MVKLSDFVCRESGHAFAGEFDPVGVVNEAVEDCAGKMALS